MRHGYTTGTTATAAAKAHAEYLLSSKELTHINVTLPDGSTTTLQVKSCASSHVCVVKDAGDDPDVTHGADICATVMINNTGSINILGGKGIGVVTKAGLQIPVGQPAINPVPLEMIRANVRDIIGNNKGADVTIFVPDGERLAEKTFNSRIGIIGGISIIGTTGIVEPMSNDALKATIACEIDVLTENMTHTFTLVPGKIGEKHIHKVYPDEPTVMTSNFIATP